MFNGSNANSTSTNCGYDVFVADSIRDGIKKEKKPERKIELETVLDSYVKGKKSLKSIGVDASIFSAYSQEEFAKITSYLANIRDIQTNTDGTVTVKGMNALDAAKVSEMTRLVLNVQDVTLK